MTAATAQRVSASQARGVGREGSRSWMTYLDAAGITSRSATILTNAPDASAGRALILDLLQRQERLAASASRYSAVGRRAKARVRLLRRALRAS